MTGKDLETIRDFFSADSYALKTTGITIEEADAGNAVCSMLPDERHANADGVVQGGALYTLADFCFAVAANAGPLVNSGKPVTVTLSASVSYLRPAKIGEKLIATARCVKAGRTAGYYEVNITSADSPEKVICAVTINGINAK